MGVSGDPKMKIDKGDFGYVLEDVPHLSDYLSDLPVIFSLALVYLFFNLCICVLIFKLSVI